VGNVTFSPYSITFLWATAKPVTAALMTASPLKDWQSCSADLLHPIINDEITIPAFYIEKMFINIFLNYNIQP
jgi:hypothetical protein